MAKTNQATLPNASSGVRICESSVSILSVKKVFWRMVDIDARRGHDLEGCPMCVDSESVGLAGVILDETNEAIVFDELIVVY